MPKIPKICLLLAFLVPCVTFAQNPIDRTREVSDAAGERTAETESVYQNDMGTSPAMSDDVDPLAGEDMDVFDFGEEATSTLAREQEDTITLDFNQAEISVVLRQVADLFQLNLVIPDTLVGTTSIKLRDVTWRQVFDVVLRPVGFTYIEDGNIIRVISRDEIALEPTDTRVYIVNFATAADLAKILDGLIEKQAPINGKIVVDSRSNALVITERPSRMNKIQEIIERLDKPTDQVMIESKFIEATNRDIKNIGINWASLSGYELGLGPFARGYQEENTRTISNQETVGPRSVNVSETINTVTVDNTTGQVTQNETTTTTGVRDFGTNSDGTPDSPTDLFEGEALTDKIWENVATGTTTAVFSAPQFNVVLSALKSNNDVKLVSNPTVVTLNNTPATINIGEEYPIPSYNYNQERGVFEVSGFEYKEIGINLDVTPQVNSAGFINLNVAPEVSSRNGSVNFGGAGGAEIPIITSRKTATQIAIKDGYTLAIGGLVEQQDSFGGSKVPVLGDIPGLGRLFRSKSSEESSRNLIIFITAKTLNPDGSSYQEVVDPRIIQKMGITEQDIPGYQIPSEERRLMQELKEYRSRMEEEANQNKIRQQIDALKAAKAEAEAEAAAKAAEAAEE